MIEIPDEIADDGDEQEPVDLTDLDEQLEDDDPVDDDATEAEAEEVQEA